MDYNKNALRNWGNLGSFPIDPASGDYITNNLNSLFIEAVIKRKCFSSQVVYAFRNSTNSLASFGLGKGFNFQGGYVFIITWNYLLDTQVPMQQDF